MIAIAGMQCVEVHSGGPADGGGGGGAVDLGVLLMHGYGADPSQFTQIVDLLVQAQPALRQKRIRWGFPAAPTQNGPAGSEWFPLDIPSWMMAFMGGQDVLAGKLRETPAGIKEASEAVVGLLKELVRTTPAGAAGESLGKWLVGGFSQGAMMTVDVCSRLDESPAGMLILSGMPMNINEWAAGMAKHKDKGVKVLQLHGRADMTCPFAASGWLRDLVGNGVGSSCLTYHAHSGAHDMGGMTEIKMIADYVASLA